MKIQTLLRAELQKVKIHIPEQQHTALTFINKNEYIQFRSFQKYVVNDCTVELTITLIQLINFIVC
jgi:hypothetical protein